jgi:hypothetical protein
MSIERDIKEGAMKSVDTIIRTHIAEALGKDPEALIAVVVKEAMAATPNSHTRQTNFQIAVNKMIREAAQEEFQLWLDNRRPLIREAIQARMTREGQGFVEMVADKVVNGMAQSFTCHLSLSIQD